MHLIVPVRRHQRQLSAASIRKYAILIARHTSWRTHTPRLSALINHLTRVRGAGKTCEANHPSSKEYMHRQSGNQHDLWGLGWVRIRADDAPPTAQRVVLLYEQLDLQRLNGRNG